MKPETLEQFLWDMLRGMTHVHMKTESYADSDAHSSLYEVHNKLLEGYNETPPRRPTRRKELRRR